MYSTRPLSSQRGAVLFVALIILILLTLLGVTAMQVTLLQERMSGNYRASQLAFERSESRMAEGRDDSADPLWAYDWIYDTPIDFTIGQGSPWADWLAYPPEEHPAAGSSLRDGVEADPANQKIAVTRACGGACPERRGSIVGDDPNKKPRFYVISSQQKDPMSPDDSAAWAMVQTIYVF